MISTKGRDVMEKDKFVKNFDDAKNGLLKTTKNIFSLDNRIGKTSIRFVASALIFVVCVAKIVASGYNPFIYFRF